MQVSHGTKITGSLLDDCLYLGTPGSRQANSTGEDWTRWITWHAKLTRSQMAVGFMRCFQLDEASTDNPDAWRIAFLVAAKQENTHHGQLDKSSSGGEICLTASISDCTLHNMKTETRLHNQTAQERRDTVIDAAIIEFAQKGLHGTSTEDIARRAGISQPYIFRLFGTKKDLFIAACERTYAQVTTSFEQALSEAPEGTAQQRLQRMGGSYTQLLQTRANLLMLLQSFASTDDQDIQAVMRQHFAELVAWVQTATGASLDEVRGFFAYGMLLTVLASLDLPQVLGFDSWADCIRESKLPELQSRTVRFSSVHNQ